MNTTQCPTCHTWYLSVYDHCPWCGELNDDEHAGSRGPQEFLQPHQTEHVVFGHPDEKETDR